MFHARKSRYVGEIGPEPLQDAIQATQHNGRRRLGMRFTSQR
jgi:hypothetical protein